MPGQDEELAGPLRRSLTQSAHKDGDAVDVVIPTRQLNQEDLEKLRKQLLRSTTRTVSIDSEAAPQGDDLSKPKPGDVVEIGGKIYAVQNDGQLEQLTEKERRIWELVGDPSELKTVCLERMARTIADLEERVRQLEAAALGKPLEEVT